GGAGERLPAAVRERVGERRPSSRPDVGGADLDAEQVPGGAEEDVLAVGVAQVGRFADDRGGVGRADVERVVGAGRDVVRADLAAEPGQRGGDVDHVVDVDAVEVGAGRLVHGEGRGLQVVEAVLGAAA